MITYCRNFILKTLIKRVHQVEQFKIKVYLSLNQCINTTLIMDLLIHTRSIATLPSTFKTVINGFSLQHQFLKKY